MSQKGEEREEGEAQANMVTRKFLGQEGLLFNILFIEE